LVSSAGKRHPGLADRHPRRAGDAAHEKILLIGGLAQGIDLPAGLGMADGAGELGRQGDEKGGVIVPESPLFQLLDHQYTEQLAVLGDGDPQKGVIALLPGDRKIFVSGVIGGVVHIDGLGTLGHQTDQAFCKAETHGETGLGVEPLGGHQHQLTLTGGDQIHRTDIDLEGPFHPLDNDVQDPCQAVGGIDLLYDAS
jgi:hypothetical protein